MKKSSIVTLAAATTLSSIAFADVKVQMTPAPKLSSEDGSITFQPMGRLHLDAGFFQDDATDHPDGANLRRARLGAKGVVTSDWAYKLELDFGKSSTVDLKDAYIAYKGWDKATVKLGNFKPSLGLENHTSSNDITLIERSAPTAAFASSQKLGIGAQGYCPDKPMTWAVGLFNDKASNSGGDDESWSASTRFTYAPTFDDTLIHVGIGADYRSPEGDTVQYKEKGENKITGNSLVDTGTIADLENVLIGAIELAVKHNNVSLQGEYYMADVATETGADVGFEGYYGQVSWIVTGEERKYKSKAGKFGGVKPANPVGKGDGMGALELVARYSHLDLTDGTITGGEQDNVTLGANWYLNNNVRLMANYIMVDTDDDAKVANDDPSVFLVRAQLKF